jgi:hypothetical protein
MMYLGNYQKLINVQACMFLERNNEKTHDKNQSLFAEEKRFYQLTF